MQKQKRGFVPVWAIILVLLVLVGSVAYYAVKKQKESAGNSLTAPEKADIKKDVDTTSKDDIMMKDEMMNGDTLKTNESMMMGPKTHKIEMTAAGFSPKELKIKKGDTVEFINKDSRQRWPASGIHPAHQVCQGFDALKPISPGETYAFTFNQAKTCPMHDHMMPNLFGKIVVE